MNNSTQHHGQTFQPWYIPVYQLGAAICGVTKARTLAEAVRKGIQIIDKQGIQTTLPDNFETLINAGELRILQDGREMSADIFARLLKNIRKQRSEEAERPKWL